MQKPPGVGSPARASAARLAALVPMRAVSVASKRGRVNTLMASLVRPWRRAFPLPARGERVGGGDLATLRCSDARRGPLTLVRFTHSTSPHARGEVNHRT